MSLFRRGAIFATFFGACLSVALLAAALGTRHWLEARARRLSNPAESDGRVHFGLFEGRKELNVAYGWRTYEIKIAELARSDGEVLQLGLWAATVGCAGAAALLAVIAALFAVANTAAAPSGALAGVPGLYLWNSLSLLFSLSTVSLWVAQFYLKLQYNVMSLEDQRNMWSSEGMAKFGYSFWFVIGAAVVSFANIVTIYIGTTERHKQKAPKPMIEEKSNGAIMLY